MKEAELKIIADMTVALTDIRKKSCDHLCIENFAPELFGKLLKEFHMALIVTEPVIGMSIGDPWAGHVIDGRPV